MAATKKTGSYKGKSNALGGGGRAAQLIDQGVPPAVVGALARKSGVYGHNDFRKGKGKGVRPQGK